MKLSVHPNRELAIAIGHLGAAYQAFDCIRVPAEDGDDYPKCIAALSRWRANRQVDWFNP